MRGKAVTYCIGILLDEGVVLASDSRTNAGIDRVSTFRKMFTFEKPGERFFTMLTAGNLSLTQGVISLISEWLNNENPEQDLFRGELDVRGGACRWHGIEGSSQDRRRLFAATRGGFHCLVHTWRTAQERPAQAIHDL
jgi:hypothetical protein